MFVATTKGTLKARFYKKCHQNMNLYKRICNKPGNPITGQELGLKSGLTHHRLSRYESEINFIFK